MAAALGAGAPANYHALIFGFNTADTAPLAGNVTGTPGYDAQTHLTAFPCADPGSFTAADVGKWASFDNGPWLQIVAVSGDIIYVAGDFAGVTGIAGDLLISRHPHSTGGQLTTALAYSSGVTTLEDAAAQFAAYMVGWQVMLNPAQPVLRTISAVPSATQLQFAGDGVNLAATGDFYRVFAPPGVMGDANGANWGHQHCDVRYGCSVSFGWAGYRYFAPVAGFVADHSGGGFDVHGRQGASINLVGNYHCWNRVYSPYLGRWTTPDPLASPWWNLQDYCRNRSPLLVDPSGTWVPAVVGGGILIGGILLVGGCKADEPKPAAPPLAASSSVPVECGTFSYKNTSNTVGNVELDNLETGLPHHNFEVSFAPNNQCCECEEISMLQFVRTTHSETEPNIIKQIPDARKDGVVKSTGKHSHYDSEGWKVDYHRSTGNWKYAGEKPKASDGLGTHGFKKGDRSSPASVKDGPGTKYSSYQDFYICAVCDNGTLLGCVYLQLKTTRTGKYASTTLETPMQDAGFDAAYLNDDPSVRAWNNGEPKGNQIPTFKDCPLRKK